jgi:hypothetical protein
MPYRKKNVPQSKSREKKKREKESMTQLQNKSKRIISKQGVFRKVNKIIPTHLHISIKLHD